MTTLKLRTLGIVFLALLMALIYLTYAIFTKKFSSYDRVTLAPGERRTITFTLDPRDLAFADEKGVMRVSPATYRLWVGGGQPDTGAPGVAGSFTTTGSTVLPR